MRSSEAGFVFEQLEPAAPVVEVPVAETDEHAELAEIRERARAEGYEEGLAAGLQSGRAQVDAAAAALGEALTEAQQRLESDADLLEWQAVELAVQLSEKILAGALEVTPERVTDVIKGGLRRLVERDRVTVLVNPDDLELVRSSLDGITASLGGIERLEAQGERRVGRGGAVLRTPVGEIDAKLETQLERVREVVVRELAAPDLEEAS
jgi:flagellar assembly protein FliH